MYYCKRNLEPGSGLCELSNMATMENSREFHVTLSTESSIAESLKDMTEFGKDILSFSDIMRRATWTCGNNHKIHHEEHFAWNNLRWCWEMNVKNAENLRDFFVTFDKAIKVDQQDELNKPILLGVYQIIETLSSNIKQLNPRFEGLLVRMGSVHNGTKIYKPDEFDFAYELDIDRLLMGQGRFKRIGSKGGRMRIVVDLYDQHEHYNLFDFPEDLSLITLLDRSGEYILYRQLISQEGDEHVVNTEHLAYAFYSLLQNALSQIEFPVGWCHGGVNRPLFSGIRINPPAFLIQLDYIGTENRKPIYLSIDFAPVLRIPAVFNYTEDVVNEHLIQNEYVRYSWLRLDAGLCKIAFYSHAEEIWLAEYAANSISKSAMRICKGVCHLAKLDSPKCVPRCLGISIANKRKDIREGKTENVSLASAFVESSLLNNNLSCEPSFRNVPKDATNEDLGEVGRNEFLSSYMFKRAVMTLMVLDEDNGQSWTEDDLPGLVIYVFMIINDILMSENLSSYVPVSNQILGETDGLKRGVIEMHPRFAVKSLKSIMCNEMKPSTLIKQFRVPLDVYEHQQTNIGDEDENGENDSITYDVHDNAGTTRSRTEDLSQSLSDTKESSSKKGLVDAFGWSSTKPPLYFTHLKTALKQGKCRHLVNLFKRRKFTKKPLSIGIDVRISQVFQLLQCISDGKKSAEISVWQTGEDPFENLDDNRITKRELETLLE